VNKLSWRPSTGSSAPWVPSRQGGQGGAPLSTALLTARAHASGRAAARPQPEPSPANTPSVSSNEQMGAAPDHDVFKQGVIRTLH
jgi:hypothetical protein